MVARGKHAHDWGPWHHKNWGKGWWKFCFRCGEWLEAEEFPLSGSICEVCFRILAVEVGLFPDPRP